MNKLNHHTKGIRCRALVIGAALLALLVPVTGFAQDECEIPLFVKQNLVGANVMITSDTSSSMNAATYHAGFDPDSTYAYAGIPGPFTPESTYFVAKDGTYRARDFNALYPEGTGEARLINSDNGEDGRYSGNYLNWIFYHATEAQRLTIPQVTRIQVLKEVLSNVIYRSQRLRFGMTVFQLDHGGSIIGKCGSSYTSLLAQISGITANSWTPLGETQETVLDYFSYDGPDAAIQVPCQYNFQIVVSDGLPSFDTEVSSYLHDADGDGNDPGSCTSIGSPYADWYNCSDHADDVAYYMAHEDLRPDLDGDQNVVTYVVGFHNDSQLLQDMAENGDGLFFHAENAMDLALSIEYAVQDILRRISAGSAVAVVSTERGTDDRLYRGKFMPIDWDGFLESYALPYRDGDAAIWEAGSLLAERNRTTRRIFTGVGDNMYKFDPGNAGDLKDAMNIATEEEAARVIAWGRGHDVPGLRDRRGWILGDIVHSTPVVVAGPSDFNRVQSYQDFRAAHENRRKMVYVGANDGMLHAFDATDGDEVWAFVPEFALPVFEAMADSFYCHRYSVDQTVSVKDVMVDGQWRTVLVSGGREGGSSIFALDITDPEMPDLLWQADLPNGKDFHSEVEFANVGGRPVVLVGSGLDIDTGEALLYAFDTTSGDFLGESSLSASAKVRNKTSRPVPLDVNMDGRTDLVYVADYLGSIWRFRVGSDPDPATWAKTRLYAGTDNVTADPVVAFGPNGNVNVYFGTGAYLEDEDMITTDQQYFVCVFDNHSGSTYTKKNLANQTSSINDVTKNAGWYVELWNELGERVTEQALVVAETVIFTSFAPTLDACVAGGTSYLYQMRYDTGGVPDVDGMEGPEDRSVDLGEGIASYPVVDLTEGTVVVQSSDASISIEPIASVYQRLQVRSWQESFDHVAPVDQVGGTQVP